MKITTLIAACIFTAFGIYGQVTTSSDCQVTGGGNANLIIFTNYDGGVLNINVDQNIPNLKIGVCSYEPVTINISGTYAANVTEVIYAGYVSTNNFHCSNSPSTTTINSAFGTSNVNFLPPSTLANPNGYSSIVCAYSCSSNTNQGGCNTADQIVDYFQVTTGGSLLWYFTQYSCWNSTPYNVTDGGNCNLTTVTTVTTSFTTSDTSICVGAPINFTDQSPGSTAWNWDLSGSDQASSTMQNPSGITWSTPGTYTVTLSSSSNSGACSTTQQIVVNALPLVSITPSDTTVCDGESVTLTASGTGTYLWQPGGLTDSSVTVSPSQTTTYTVSSTDANGCVGTGNSNITVNSLPATPTITYNAALLTAPSGGTTYQWYLNGNLLPTQNGSTCSPPQNGVYTVVITDVNGCQSESSLPFTVQDLSVEEVLNDAAWSLFPNPVVGSENVIIQLTNGEKAQVTLFDLSGRIIASYSMNSSEMKLPITGLSSGNYVVELDTYQWKSRKFLVIN